MAKTRPSKFEPKTPVEEKVYAIDFAEELIDGDTIASVVWTSTPSGLTFANGVIDDRVAHIRIGGGTDAVTYCVKAQMQKTTSGEVIDAWTDLTVSAACG